MRSRSCRLHANPLFEKTLEYRKPWRQKASHGMCRLQQLELNSVDGALNAISDMIVGTEVKISMANEDWAWLEDHTPALSDLIQRLLL